MAAPLYTWKFHRDLWGDRVPKIATMEASADLEVKVGTLLVNNAGQVDEAGASVAGVVGIAMQDLGPLEAGDPVKVALLAPGMEIEGTADADATALAGFAQKTVDLNADGSLDVGDLAGGCLSVHRVENSGLRVYCTVTDFAAG
jgi:hypothetical protein